MMRHLEMTVQPQDICSVKLLVSFRWIFCENTIFHCCLTFPSEKIGGTLANYSACLQLEEYLCSKLAKNNHNTKYKCLLVIKVCSFNMLVFLYRCLYLSFIIIACLSNWSCRFQEGYVRTC